MYQKLYIGYKIYSIFEVIQMSLRKLNNLDASDILARTPLDEVPKGFRDEVFVEEDNEGVIDNWFVGSEGAVSNSGTTLTIKEWNDEYET
jgi:hypothetical protein